MKRFTELCSLLSQASSAPYKQILLREYLNNAPDNEILWAVYLLSGRKFKRIFNISLLWEILPELTGLPEWLINESLQISGDKAETISLIMPVNTTENNFSLPDIILFADEIHELKNSEKFQKILNILVKLTSAEKLIFLKLVSGSFRPHINKYEIASALSQKYSITAISAFHLINSADPCSNDLKDLMKYYKRNKDIFDSYPFSSTGNADTITLQNSECKEWFAEWKWDGIRVQVICRKGELLIWSKAGELVTEKFPELFNLSRSLKSGTVLDGEIIAFSSGKPLPYGVLQKRIDTKYVSNSITGEYPAAFIAYDVLENNDSDIRSKSLIERRKILEEIAESCSEYEKLFISPLLEFRTWKALTEIKNSAAENFSKGIIIKRKNSAYNADDNWFSLNLEPHSFNGVLLYAERSLNSSLYSEFTFGAWFNDELITFAKAGGGLSETELAEIAAFINENTLEKFGPVRTVKPELVFEIHFEGIAESNRRKSGITLRAPRINRWLKDKKPHEAGHLISLRELLNGSK